MTTERRSPPWLWTSTGGQGTTLPSVGAVLREVRAARNLTQADLAAVLNVDQSYVSKIEKGKRQIRDLGVLLRICEQLGIAPGRVGLSSDLIQAMQHRGTVSAATGPVTRPSRQPRPLMPAARTGGPFVDTSTNIGLTWRGEALSLYGSERQLGTTPLITLPEWTPDQPVALDDVALTWLADPPRPRVSGAEPEARRFCPLRAPGQQYDTYTSAVRYIDSPTLFENRPSYRLLDVSLSGDETRMSFGLATYFDKLDISETLGHEQAAVAVARAGHRTASTIGLQDLPFRALVGDPFDLRRRAVIPAITTLTIRMESSGRAAFLLHWRDAAHVATAGGMYDVIPAGEFQPSSVMAWDQRNDFSLWRNIVREMSEELLGTPEHDGTRSAPIDYDGWPLYRNLCRAREAGKLAVCCLGVGLDALTLAATILTVIVVDGETFDEIFDGVVRQNSEGFTVVAGDGHTPAEGIPFNEENIKRLLTSEPLASPGAACLYQAWKHREHLLGAPEQLN